jgi:hypothetical protein
MEKINEELLRLAEQITKTQQIKIADIPCVDLYMDQVTTFFDDKLKDLKRDEEDKILTKTMINNYAKAKLLLPVKGKKYSNEQMVLLALIYNLKQVLSINDIGTLLSPLISSISSGKKDFPLNEIYSIFLDLNKLQMEEFSEKFSEKVELVEEKANAIHSSDEETIKLLLTVLMLISSAHTQKRMAESIIDSFLHKK